MTSAWHSSDFSMVRVLALRASALVAPSLPSLADQAALNDQQCTLDLEDGLLGDTPEWVRLVCIHRKEFKGCGLLGIVGGETKAFAFVYATQRPYMVTLSALLPSEKIRPPLKDLSFEQQKRGLQDHFDHEFRAQLGHSQQHDTIAFDEGQEIHVIPHSVHLQDGRQCSHFNVVPLSTFCASLPKASARKAGTEASEAEPSILDPDL
eukprot:16452284-Heterocapsa_arctica.AAC.1